MLRGAEKMPRQIATLRSGIEGLLAIARIHEQSLELSQRQFEILVQEIRGLKVENHRILIHLFCENQQE